MQTNDVGMDEFMTFCKLIGVEPYITVNAGFGDAWSAKEYVEYCNGAPTTPMGRLRAISKARRLVLRRDRRRLKRSPPATTCRAETPARLPATAILWKAPASPPTANSSP